jgi:hypothetical protein
VRNAMGHSFIIHTNPADGDTHSAHAEQEGSRPVTPSHSTSTPSSDAGEDKGEEEENTSHKAIASKKRAVPPPPPKRESKNRVPARALAPEELLRFVEHGTPFIMHSLVQGSTTEATRDFVYVFYSPELKAICWTYTSEAVEGDPSNEAQWAMLRSTENTEQRLDMDTLTDIYLGKHTLVGAAQCVCLCVS